MTITTDRAIEIAKHIESQAQTFRAKYDRARRPDYRERYWEKYCLYRDFSNRAFHLIFNLRHPKRFGIRSLLYQTPEEFRKRQQNRIAKGKERFERLHTYSTWFMQTSFRSDYGTYKCNKCGRVFYHSPSTIYRAKAVVYNCACGYCTNDIIKSDYNQEPYH